MNINQIINHWKNENIKLNEGASLQTIEAIENTVKFIFPDDFKDFYQQANGFKNNDWTKDMFSIFPLERILDEYLSSNNFDFIPFCDFLINSHQIGFSKIEKGIFVDYRVSSINHSDKISNFFTQTLIEILHNSDKVY